MRKAKLLSLLLAGSLLFHTAGIDALATAPSEPAPANEAVESTDTGTSEQPSEENEDNESKDSSEKEGNVEQPSEEDVDNENKDSSEKEGNTEQPSEEDVDDKDKDLSEEESNTEQPAEENEESESPADDVETSDDSVSENTISENTISENTLPEDEVSLFSIFPGLGENYKFSSQQLADKRVLASHAGDVVKVNAEEATSIEDYVDVEGAYEPGEVIYLAETKAEAKQVAEAFGGTLESYSNEVAVINLPKKATVALAIAAAAEPDIKLPAVWPNYYNYLYDDIYATTTDSLILSDPDYKWQWQHDYIGTRYAWAAGFKGDGVKVAVIDTGLDRNHEDLKDNAIDGKNFVNAAGGTKYNADNQTHGTHVAGIIAADDNKKGGVGIAPDATVQGYCVFPASGGAKTSDVIDAINDAVAANDIDIINMSLGTAYYSALYETALKAAYEAGVAVFAAAGNEDSDTYAFPAAYASTISVGAVDENSTRAYFSNYGKTVTLSFPGVKIYSTYPTGKGEGNGNYGYMSGTSQACPAAAGTAAVILSAREDIRKQTGKAKVNALLSAMKSSTTKCAGSGMGAGTTYLPGVLKIATDMTAPETPVIEVIEKVNGTPIERGTNKKDYIAESIDVTISTKTAVGVDIYYSTDGKAPAYKNGQITNVDNPKTPYRLGDKITLTGAKSKTIKAIAVNPFSGKVSKVASKTVTLTPLPKKVNVASVDNVNKIAAGKSLKFTATVELPYAISNQVKWSVDAKAKEAGITVSNGTVKTKATTTAGKYTVTATAVGNAKKEFNGVIGTAEFNVIETAAITKIAFVDEATTKAPTAKSIKTIDSKTTDSDKIIDLKEYLTVTKTTDAATKTETVLTKADAAKEVVWSSSNTKVATVSDGVITAVAPGKATIKAISNDGGNKSASYSVTVVQPVRKITISGPTKVAPGKGIALTATVGPDNATNKKVEWTVVGGDDKVSINKSNGKISTKRDASGTYTVTATAADMLGATATCNITIASEEITKITLNEKKLTMFPPNTSASKNTTATLTAKVEGKKAGNNAVTQLDNPLITWTSSAPDIASVTQSGVIIAKASGKATITCVATDGSNKKATCAVTVTTPMSKLVIGPTDGNEGVIAVGKKVKMAAKYYSNYGTPTNKKVDWKITRTNNNTLLAGKVSIDKNGTLSVAKDLILPQNSTVIVQIQATAQDGSGVESNTFNLIIMPSYVAIRLALIRTSDKNGKITGYYFGVEGTAYKKNGKPDWEMAEDISFDYCTAAVSGTKNCGLDKWWDEGGRPYYGPVPLKYTSVQVDYILYPELGRRAILYTKDCDKITLTVKLKDGSNLTAKDSWYAVHYTNLDGNIVVGYLK